MTHDPAAAYGLLTVGVVMGLFGRSIDFIRDSGPMGLPVDLDRRPSDGRHARASASSHFPG